jgi:Fe-S cluster assembly iron-binding protein IscA
MTITDAAIEKLKILRSKAGKDVSGLRISGFVGTCRGSTPVLKPAATPESDDCTLSIAGITLYIAAEYAALLRDAVLDYDRSFLGRGLTMTWPHHDECPCHGRQTAPTCNGDN